MLVTVIVAVALVAVILILGKIHAAHLPHDSGDRRVEGTTVVKVEAEEQKVAAGQED